MKKDTITEEKAKKTPAGGVLVGKREGQTIIHDKGTQGGYFVGKLHKEGGIKGINKSTGQPIEVQGGEVIITAPAVADQTKREFEGEMLTNREILSKINERGGGVSLENGGEIYYNGSSYNYGGKTMTDYEIMQEISNCGCEHKYNHGGLSKGKSLQDIADMHNVSLSSIKKELAKGKKVESEHTSDKKLAEKIAKDHLVENPNYYTILDKVGLENGGEIENNKKLINWFVGWYKDDVYKKMNIIVSIPFFDYNYGVDNVNKDNIVVLDIFEKKDQNIDAKKYLKEICDKADDYGVIILLEPEPRFNYIQDNESKKQKITKEYLINYYSKFDFEKIKNKEFLIRLPKNKNKIFNNGGQLDLVKESKKGDHPARDLNNYNDVMDLGADGQVGMENGLAFADGGDLDFLDDAVKKFDDGGSITNEVEAIELSQGSATYWGTMPKTQYNSFNEFLSDLQTAFINKEKRGGYFYFWILKDGMRINSVKLAIQFKNGKNTVLNFNPLTGKSSDFLKQLERRYGSTIRRNNLDFSKWLGGKSTPKPQPKPEPTKEKAIRVKFSVVENNSVIAEDSFYYASAFFEYLKVFSDRDVKVIIDLEKIGGTYIANDSFYLQKENEDIKHFNIDRVPTKILERFFVNYFQNIDLSELFGGKENVPKPMSYDELRDFFSQKPEPKKEEVKIDFEATKKYLNVRIADLSKELNFKRPRLSNEEIGFYQREINNLIERLRMLIEKQLDTLPLRLRLDDAFSLKWGNINAEYKPAQDLLAPNGLPTKLTEEEYLNVRTPYFSSFFGDWQLANETGDFSGVSKVLDPETKEPMPVYHGTNVLFTEWKTYKTNNAHYFAKNRDFSQWFAEQWSKGRGDISAKDSNLIKQLNPNKGEYLYRCFLDIKNPIDFSRFGVEKRPVSDFLMFLQINYNIGDFDFWTNFRLFNNLTQDTLVYSWMIIRNWQSFTEYIKMATTYDGYIFYEYHPEKVGTGLDGASLSFCAFDSNQIKFTNATEFNALITDSRFEQGGKL